MDSMKELCSKTPDADTGWCHCIYLGEEALELCYQEALFSPVMCCVATTGFKM